MRIHLDPNTDNAAGGTDMAALLSQLAASAPAGLKTQTAAAGQTQEQPAAKAETAAKTETAAKPLDDVYRWLADLQTKLTAKDTREKADAATREREDLTRQITKLVGEGDVAKLRDALSKLEGHYTGKLGEKDQALKAVQDRLHDTVRKTSITEAVAGVDFASAAAARDALGKLEARVEVVLDAQGSPVVREKGTGRAVADLVKEALASEEFSHFLGAGQRGRGGLGSGHSASPSPTNAGAPADLVEGVLAKIEFQKKQFAQSGLFQTSGLRSSRPAKR